MTPEGDRMTDSASDWRPRVTALLPSWNAAAFIQPTLDCLAAQTWPELEILIGDDRSTDATPEIIRAFAASQSNVRILERPANMGWLRNANDLMANASGELMFFAFHDDVVDPTYVETLVAAMRDRPAAIMAFSDMDVRELDGTVTRWGFDALDGVTGAVRRGKVMARRGDGWWVPNRGLFRAEAFRRIDGIRPNACGEFSADWTWLFHMAILGDFVRVPEVLVHKVYQTGSLSKRWTHSPEQQTALWRAGLTELGLSPLSRPQKAYLAAYLTWHHRVPISRSLRRRLRQRLGRA